MSEVCQRNVICMKWGSKFGAEYVNRLFNMVERHLTLEHRFVCFTDDASGINPKVEIRPLPPMDLAPGAPERGWRKLTLFNNPLADLSGTALFLDLDVVIKGSLNEFFEVSGAFLICKDWDFPKDIIGNSSVFRFEVGKHEYVIKDFLANTAEMKQRFRNEQAYLSNAIADHGTLDYWSADWCVSFKRNCLWPWPMGYLKTPRDPEGAKIIVFHGKPNPEQAYSGYCSKCGFRYIRPTKWLDRYWN